MSLKTYSAFTYGHDISEDNQCIDFSENGVDVLVAQIDVGAYSLDEFQDKIAAALNDAGELIYTVGLDRQTRIFTISASAPFEIITDGPRSAISALPLIGFTTNRTGLNSYSGDVGSGFVYYPQYKLQRFIDFEDNVEASDSSVNTSASGIVEVVSFGRVLSMKCNITYVTDIVGQGAIINNPTGVSDLRNFMNYAILKKPIEFIPDVDDLEVFTKCILESTPSNRNGTGFVLNELYSRGLANYFETGTLTFRKV